MDTFNAAHVYTSRQIKIDDDGDNEPDNVITIFEHPKLQIGTHGRIGECALVLGKYLLELAPDAYFLELGCGTGVLSILLSSRGGQAMATDLYEAKQLCELNIKTNKCQVRYEYLDWKHNPTKIESTIGHAIKDITYIVASECVFNTDTLLDFPKCLNNIYDIFAKAGRTNIITYMAHKTRYEEIDKRLYEQLELLGFWVEDVDFQSLNDQWRNRTVSVQRLGRSLDNEL